MPLKDILRVGVIGGLSAGLLAATLYALADMLGFGTHQLQQMLFMAATSGAAVAGVMWMNRRKRR